MKPQNPLVEVTIYVWGDALDPADVTSCLGIEPSFSRRKGEKRTTRTRREISAKTSVWSLTADADVDDLSVHIQELASKVGDRSSEVYGVAGVEGAYVDVFVATSSASGGEAQYCFRLNQQDISALQRLGLPVEFALHTGKE